MPEIALVGPPSHGKSTLFMASTMKDVAIADYPFTTIDPNEGVAFYRTRCPCMEKGISCSSQFCHSGRRYVPFKLWDVAGLVEGAHEGRGRGLEFLNDIAKADALVIVVDASGRTGIDGIQGGEMSGNPVKVVRAIERELDYWYLSVLQREMRKIKGLSSSMPVEKAIAERFSGMKVSEEHVSRALDEVGTLEGSEIEFASLLRKMSKPVVVAANKADIAGKDDIDRLREYLPYPVVPVSAYYELALREAARKGIVEYFPGDREFMIIDANPEQEKALEKIADFMEMNGGTGVQELMNSAVHAAGYVPVFPVEDEHSWTDSKGNVLPDAMLVKTGTTARQLAYFIHEDIGRGFVAAIDARTGRRIGGDDILESGAVVSIKHRGR